MIESTLRECSAKVIIAPQTKASKKQAISEAWDELHTYGVIIRPLVRVLRPHQMHSV